MTSVRQRAAVRGFAIIAVGASALGGCSSMPSLTGSGSPFGGGSNVVDRTFIGAAQTWDFDKNGSVTCDEWKNYATSLLKESDGDGNGSLDSAEFQTMAKTDRLFEVADVKYFDGNGDGRVTGEELTGRQNTAFKLLDKNGDCQIDRNESVKVLQVDAPKSSGQAPNTDQQGPGSIGGRR